MSKWPRGHIPLAYYCPGPSRRRRLRRTTDAAVSPELPTTPAARLDRLLFFIARAKNVLDACADDARVFEDAGIGPPQLVEMGRALEWAHEEGERWLERRRRRADAPPT